MERSWCPASIGVPLWAKGDAARVFKNYATIRDPLRGAYMDNTDIIGDMYRSVTGMT
jgi:hypothetical protein